KSSRWAARSGRAGSTTGSKLAPRARLASFRASARPFPETAASGEGWGGLGGLAGSLATSSPPWPGESTTTTFCPGSALERRSEGRTVTATRKRGRIRVASQKARPLIRCRYSRLATIRILSSCIAHRLDEDGLELRLLGAELADVHELNDLPE